MAIFTLKQKIFIVKRYYQCGNSTQMVQKEYSSEFRDGDNIPTDDNITELVYLFEEIGSILNYRKTDKPIIADYAEESTVDSYEIKPDFSSDEESLSENQINGEFDKQGIDDVSEMVGSIEATTSNDVLIENLGIGEVSKKCRSVEQREGSNISRRQCDNQFKMKSTYSDNLRINKEECVISNNKVSDLIIYTTPYAEKTLYPGTENESCLKKEGHLEDNVILNNNENIYSCKTCEKSFKTRIRLKAHERCHLTDKERPIKCEICGKGFLKPYALKLHFRTHTGEKNPVCICDICGQRLSSNRALKYHMRIHTGEKPHECPFCDKKYRQIFNLIVHKRSHTGEKPFMCNICGKSMTKNSSLKNHIETIHEGAKPYQCPFCDNKYTAWTTLQIHKRIHTGERPYVCQYCSKDFYDLGTCRRHERTHTGKKLFECTICGESQNQISKLKTHMKNKHNQELE